MDWKHRGALISTFAPTKYYDHQEFLGNLISLTVWGHFMVDLSKFQYQQDMLILCEKCFYT